MKVEDSATSKWRESSGRYGSSKSWFDEPSSATLNLRPCIRAARLTEAHCKQQAISQELAPLYFSSQFQRLLPETTDLELEDRIGIAWKCIAGQLVGVFLLKVLESMNVHHCVLLREVGIGICPKRPHVIRSHGFRQKCEICVTVFRATLVGNAGKIISRACNTTLGSTSQHWRNF